MRAAVILAALLIVPAAAFSSTLVVPDDYGTIQAAIDAAMAGDTVLVKPGTYIENIDFKGKAITVTGEQGADVSVIDGNQARSVVTCQSGEDEHSILKGFTLINGRAEDGGGMFNFQSSPTVIGCVFSGNSTDKYSGGGMFNRDGSPTVTDCTFVKNQAQLYGGGMYNWNSNTTVIRCVFSGNWTETYQGGGMYNRSSSPAVAGCTFEENWAYGAGGMYNLNGSPTVTDCTFRSNWAIYDGGGMVNNFCDPTIINCILSGNMALSNGRGGGMWNTNSDSTITNCTFSDNSAYYGGGMINWDCKPTLTNCILWGDIPDEIFLHNSPANIITYSCIQGGWSGIGNIDDDPLFVDPANGDCHLTYPSPCKDTGNNGAAGPPFEDFEGDPRIAFNTVDMGADEFHTHLYCLGNTTPGGYVEVKIIGLPGPKHSVLFAGSGVLDPFWPTPYGNWYLQLPIVTLRVFDDIPIEGLVVLAAHIPPDFPAWDIPLQTIVGNQLTNLCVLVVK